MKPFCFSFLFQNFFSSFNNCASSTYVYAKVTKESTIPWDLFPLFTFLDSNQNYLRIYHNNLKQIVKFIFMNVKQTSM